MFCSIGHEKTRELVQNLILRYYTLRVKVYDWVSNTFEKNQLRSIWNEDDILEKFKHFGINCSF